jgi:exodeoxyribonuclease X
MIRIIDLETTGTQPPPADEVLEIAAVDVVPGEERPRLFGHAFIKPTIPIPDLSKAVHHIIEDDVKDAASWGSVWPTYLGHPAPARAVDVRPRSLEEMRDTGPRLIQAFAAHRADFEAMHLTEEMRLGRPIICTYKSALRVWPKFEKHSNQALRYLLNLPVTRAEAEPPHRALPDSIVTGFLMIELLKHATIEQMIEWSGEPALLPTCPISDEWRGKPWSDVDIGFLDWVVGKKSMEADLRWNAQREINRRNSKPILVDTASGEEREAYIRLALFCTGAAGSVSDLATWFVAEKAHRDKHGILKNTPDYDLIVTACVTRKAELTGKSGDLPTEEKSNGKPEGAEAPRLL